MPPPNETYLGDGLYASYDAATDMFVLRAPRETGDHWVGLEPPVFREFIEFAERCRPGCTAKKE